MKLSVKGLAIAGGIIWALAILVVVILNIIFSEYGGEFLKLMASVYPGYKASGEIVDRFVETGEEPADGSGPGKALGEFVSDVAGVQIGEDQNVGVTLNYTLRVF